MSKQNLMLVHLLFLTLEIGALVAILLQFVVWPLDAPVVHNHVWLTTVVVSVGVGLIAASFIFNALKNTEAGFRFHGAINVHLAFWSVCIMIGGGWLVFRTFPEIMRFSGAMEEAERWKSMDAVSVSFDMNRGVCGDTWRIVKNAGRYGQTMNIYPSEDERRMNLNGVKIDLHEGWMLIERDYNTVNDYDTYVNYFTSNAIPCRVMSDMWTYVVEMAELSGSFSRWAVGQTWDTNHNVYAQLQYGTVDPAIRPGKSQFLVLKSEKWGERCNMLDRAFIQLKPNQMLKAKFRVSLFAGTDVNESNYHYVMPGETIKCSLPVPKRDGYAFEGWYDGDRRITEESKVEKRESHTLKARWRKL